MAPFRRRLHLRRRPSRRLRSLYLPRGGPAPRDCSIPSAGRTTRRWTLALGVSVQIVRLRGHHWLNGLLGTLVEWDSLEKRWLVALDGVTLGGIHLRARNLAATNGGDLEPILEGSDSASDSAASPGRSASGDTRDQTPVAAPEAFPRGQLVCVRFHGLVDEIPAVVAGTTAGGDWLLRKFDGSSLDSLASQQVALRCMTRSEASEFPSAPFLLDWLDQLDRHASDSAPPGNPWATASPQPPAAGDLPGASVGSPAAGTAPRTRSLWDSDLATSSDPHVPGPRGFSDGDLAEVHAFLTSRPPPSRPGSSDSSGGSDSSASYFSGDSHDSDAGLSPPQVSQSGGSAPEAPPPPRVGGTSPPKPPPGSPPSKAKSKPPPPELPPGFRSPPPTAKVPPAWDGAGAPSGSRPPPPKVPPPFYPPDFDDRDQVPPRAVATPNLYEQLRFSHGLYQHLPRQLPRARVNDLVTARMPSRVSVMRYRARIEEISPEGLWVCRLNWTQGPGVGKTIDTIRHLFELEWL